MRTGYPIGTIVHIGTTEYTISAVAFYPTYEKYLLFRDNDGDVKEDWYGDFYFVVGKKVNKIGFQI